MIYYIYRVGVDVAWAVILVGAVIGYYRSPKRALAVQLISVTVGVCCLATGWIREFAHWLTVPSWWLSSEQLIITGSVAIFALGYLWERIVAHSAPRTQEAGSKVGEDTHRQSGSMV